jgi:transposase
MECQALQSRLTIRRHLIRQRIAAMNVLERQLELYGGRLRRRNLSQLRTCVELEIHKIFARGNTDLARELRFLVGHCEQLVEYQRRVDRELKQQALQNDVCRRFMEIPGVGPICALTFYAIVSEPNRFRRSADIGSYFGLTPLIRQSGLKSTTGRISKMGNKAVRNRAGKRSDLLRAMESA